MFAIALVLSTAIPVFSANLAAAPIVGGTLSVSGQNIIGTGYTTDLSGTVKSINTNCFMREKDNYYNIDSNGSVIWKPGTARTTVYAPLAYHRGRTMWLTCSHWVKYNDGRPDVILGSDTYKKMP